MPRPTRAPATPTPFAAVILAGGASRRMGRDKRLLPWDRDAGGRPRTLLRSIVERLSAIASEVVVVANDRPDAGPATLVPDLYPGAGSLGGIFSGITAASHEEVFVAGADMPFINLALVRFLVHALAGADGAVPVVAERPEPLHAVYRRTFLAAARPLIEARELKIARVFEALHVRWIDEAALRAIDPTLDSFRNLNTPEEYAAARRAQDLDGADHGAR